MGYRAFERGNEVSIGWTGGRMKDAAKTPEDKYDFAGEDDNHDRHEGEHGKTEQGEGGDECFQFSHSANLSCELANADVAEGLGVA